MKIINSNPPNIDLIRTVLNPPQEAIFCYGDTIYNPSGNEIPKDIEYHETTHSKQQDGKPELWWYLYLKDKDFRFRQELEAYAHQYHIIRKNYPGKAQKEALFELAHNLSTMYNLDITLQEAESRIRNKEKQLSN